MAKLDTKQQYALGKIEVLSDEITTAKRVIRKQIEEEFERRLDDLRRQRSRAANEALALGVPKTKIGRAIGTSDWATVNETLAMTAAEFTATTEVEIEAPRAWDYDPATMVLTLHEYQQRFTTKMITAEVVVPGEMRHVMEDYTVRPIRFPEDVEVPWLNAIYKEIGRDQGMILPPQAPAAEVDSGSNSIEEQFWAQAGSENDDEEWDSE